MEYAPVFGSGLARSGGGLYSMCLSAHSQMRVACCPNLELFRSFRNAFFRSLDNSEISKACGPMSPMQDWYGTEARILLMDKLLEESDLNLLFEETEWSLFLEQSINRGELESADLTKSYESLKAATYRDIFVRLLQIIAEKRDGDQSKWIGLHEAWILDFYPALARAFPDARFLVMLRDPRATINSMLGVKEIDPSQVAQVMSYVRHWRKYVALALKFKKDPLFRGRIHITAHDLILTDTQETLEGICNAFDLTLEPRMLDTNNFFDYTTGGTWSGNSSFEAKTEGISSHRALRWRDQLDKKILAAIEYMCGSDLKLVGYPVFTEYADVNRDLDGELVKVLLEDLRFKANWRSDQNDPLLDLGLESIRRALLRLSEPSSDISLVRRTFLFEETYNAIYSNSETLLPKLIQVL